MSIVVDANVAVALITATPQGDAARDRLNRWRTEAEDLHAPQLFIYEVASALCGLEAGGSLSEASSNELWSLIDALDLTLHPPSSGAALVAIARWLQRRSVYDAAYVDLALVLKARLWTLDGKLARNAEAAGFPVTLVV